MLWKWSGCGGCLLLLPLLEALVANTTPADTPPVAKPPDKLDSFSRTLVLHLNWHNFKATTFSKNFFDENNKGSHLVKYDCYSIPLDEILILVTRKGNYKT